MRQLFSTHLYKKIGYIPFVYILLRIICVVNMAERFFVSIPPIAVHRQFDKEAFAFLCDDSEHIPIRNNIILTEPEVIEQLLAKAVSP